jgi:chromosome segregation ATPase
MPSQPSQDSIDFDGRPYVNTEAKGDAESKCLQLEAELREISVELAGSIKREMELEDLVERLQLEGPSITRDIDRTSDYFSDSGTSSIRPSTSEGNSKEDIQRIKRESEQLRAQLKVEMSQKWQNERSSRQALESHIQLLEQKLSQSRRDHNLSSDSTAKARELEVALEDAKRRLVEERQIKENFEDLLTALRVDLEQHRNERDNLRDEVVPQLRSQIEGLETNLSESQKSPYDFTRMQQEIQSLRDENAALQSARAMNMQFQSIAEEGGIVESPTSATLPNRGFGLQRSNTVHINRSNSRAGGTRSNSLSRSSSTANRAIPENNQSLADQLKDVTDQRNALHSTVKYLLRRQEAQRRQYEKRVRIAEAERDRERSLHGAKKGGYEREVRNLRSEINLLRKRADDALDQKWQCEKGLSGLKMDLDRSKQETASLQNLLQARDESAPEVLSSTLEQALRRLQQDRDQARQQGSQASPKRGQQLATELELSAQRSESLASQVRKQMQSNNDLRNRLKDAVENGEMNQHASADQINELQSKLRKLEDVITVAQMQSETAVMKHEEEVRVLRASNNFQLMRTKSGKKAPGLLTPTPRSPLSPMFVNSRKSPRLDQTSSGPGMALQQALKTEYLENKVAELEKALSEAEKEMEEVVGRMNNAQMGVAELESER